jgi:hypothetical protein
VNELLLRFLLGGVLVSIFSALGDVFRPKSFAGLFGAAPSVALATLALTISREGPSFAAIECRSMIFGAIALALYSLVVSRLLLRRKWSALAVTTACIPLWLGACAALHGAFG